MNTQFRTVIFHSLAANPAISFDFERYLFNEPRHLISQGGELCYTFLMFDSETAVARFSCFVEEGRGLSPRRATFGGIEFSETLDDNTLDSFVWQIVDWAKDKPLHSLQITLYPEAYSPLLVQRLQKSLTRYGFLVLFSEQNQHLIIDGNSFANGLHHSNRRRLKKCEQAGFEFKALTISYLPDFYKLLTEARNSKNYPISLSLDELVALFEQFPHDFLLFGVFDQQRLISACVAVRINARILYYFLPADSLDYLHFSPSVMLIDGLYRYGQQNSFELLDLGISSLKGQLNQGLWQFKQRLGALESEKVVWVRENG